MSPVLQIVVASTFECTLFLALSSTFMSSIDEFIILGSSLCVMAPVDTPSLDPIAATFRFARNASTSYRTFLRAPAMTLIRDGCCIATILFTSLVRPTLFTSTDRCGTISACNWTEIHERGGTSRHSGCGL